MNRNHKVSTLITLAIIMICTFFWYARTLYRDSIFNVVNAYSVDGVWDLREIEFDNAVVNLKGNIEFVKDKIVGPEEFDNHTISIGSPIDNYEIRTSRYTLILPKEAYYKINVLGSFAKTVFVNGERRMDVGVISEKPEEFQADYRHELIDVYAEGNVLKIVVQGGNYIDNIGSSYNEILIGYPKVLNVYSEIPRIIEGLMLGLFITLFMVHLAMFFTFKNARTNLIFAMLCLTWFLRVGVTGERIVFEILPNLTWIVSHRMEYISVHATVFLIFLLIETQFAMEKNKWLEYIMYLCFIIYTFIFVFIDTYYLPIALITLYGFYSIIVVYMVIRLVKWIIYNSAMENIKEKDVFILVALSIFLYASIHDVCHYLGIYLFDLEYTLSDVAMSIFVLCEMLAIFYDNMGIVKKAQIDAVQSRDQTEELKKFLQMKSHFMTIVAHEIKTPLSVIMGGANETLELLDIEPVEFDVIKEDQHIIMEMVNGLNNTVFDLLDATAIETGRLTMRKQPVQLSSFLMDIVRQYSFQEERKNEIILDIEKDLPKVMVDEKRLSQVMLNVLSNASRYTYNGKITIKLSEKQNDQIISVKDTGSGMSEEVLNKLTKGFIDGGPHGFRGGIGLYVCQQIILAHGGKMKIDSKEKVGTTVTFNISTLGGTSDNE